jgi:hypothetical protein
MCEMSSLQLYYLRLFLPFVRKSWRRKDVKAQVESLAKPKVFESNQVVRVGPIIGRKF